MFQGLACFGQSKPVDKNYELYLTQIAAAEAFLQLNKISTAHQYLNATDEQFRGVEWQFLKAALDQSSRTLLKKPGMTFTSVKLSPDGKMLAVSGSDSLISLYSFPELRLIRELRGHTNSVSTIDFSRDGKKVASGGRDHRVIIWDVETGRQIANNDVSFSQGIYQVRFHPDNLRLGVVSWERIKDREPYIFGFVKLLDTKNLEEVFRIELDNHPAAGIVFTPDGENMIISSWGEIVYSFNMDTKEANWKFDLSDYEEYNAFYSSDINPEGNLVAVGSTDHRVYLLNTETGEVVHGIESWEGHTKTVKAVSFSPDGKWLATGGEDQTILIWNTSDFSQKQSLTGHINTVSGIAWSKDSNTIVSSSIDETFKMWDLSNPFEKSFTICDFGPWQTPLTSDKKYFAAPCSDKKLMLYDVQTGDVVKDFGEQSGLCADLSADSKILVTASFDGLIRIWDIESSSEIKSFSGHTARIDGIEYMDRARQVLSVGDTTLRIWNLNQDREVQTISFNSAPFRIVLNPDETQAFIGFNDGLVKIFNTKLWIESASFVCSSGIQEMTVSPDGKLLAVFCGKNIELWDTETFEQTGMLIGHEKSGYGIGFSNDSGYLISGSYDQTFKLWNLSTESCTLTFHGFEDIIYSCKFLSDDAVFLSSSQGKVWVYKF